MNLIDWLQTTRSSSRPDSLAKSRPRLEFDLSPVAAMVDLLESRILMTSVSAPSSSSCTQNQNISFSASGSLTYPSDTYSWSLTNAPQGLSLSNTNTLSPTVGGTVTGAAGTYNMVLKLTESHGKTILTATANI